jgi:translation elongation factor EF-1beta
MRFTEEYKTKEQQIKNKFVKITERAELLDILNGLKAAYLLVSMGDENRAKEQLKQLISQLENFAI